MEENFANDTGDKGVRFCFTDAGVVFELPFCLTEQAVQTEPLIDPGVSLLVVPSTLIDFITAAILADSPFRGSEKIAILLSGDPELCPGEIYFIGAKGGFEAMFQSLFEGTPGEDDVRANLFLAKELMKPSKVVGSATPIYKGETLGRRPTDELLRISFMAGDVKFHLRIMPAGFHAGPARPEVDPGCKGEVTEEEAAEDD